MKIQLCLPLSFIMRSDIEFFVKVLFMKEMSLTDHLEELRKRVVYTVIIVFISFFVCYHFGIEIQDFLLAPLRSALGSSGKIIFSGLLDKVLAQFQLCFWCSIILSSPLWFHQIWLFIKPGLYDNEVKVIRPFILLGFILFCLGVGFGRFIVFPFTFQTLLEFGIGEIDAYMNMKDYLVLATKILLFLGIIFQMPNVLLILGFMGVINSKKLMEYQRYVVVGFAVIAAMLTPPDPMTMMALWLPLVLLYQLGVLLVYLAVDPWQKKRQLSFEDES